MTRREMSVVDGATGKHVRSLAAGTDRQALGIPDRQNIPTAT